MIRIYALAKELKVDNKELVDICQKVGLEGKRSALASLTDEDVALVKEFIQKSAQPSFREPSSVPEFTPMQRPVMPSLQSGKVPVLKPVRPAKRIEDPAPAPEVPVSKPEPAAETPVSESVSEVKPVEIPEVKIEKSEPLPEKPSDEKSNSEKPRAEDRPPVPERPNIKMDPSKKVPVLTPSLPKREPASEIKESKSAETPKAEEAKPEAAVSKIEETKPEAAVPKTEEIKPEAAVPKAEDLKPAAEPAAEKKLKPSPFGGLLRKDRDKKPEPNTDVLPASEPVSNAAPAPKEEEEEKPQKKELSPLELARLAAAREMSQRPPVLTVPSGDAGKKKKGNDDKNNRAKKTVGIHLAPLPTNTGKSAVKPSKDEPAPQKPEIRFKPNAAHGVMDVAPLASRVNKAADAQKGDSARSDSGRPEKKRIVGNINDEIKEIQEAAKRGDKNGKKRKGEKRTEEVGKRRGAGDFTHVHDEDPFGGYYQHQRRKKGVKAKGSTLPRKGDIVIQLPCTVKDFAEATGLSVAAVIKKMMELGYMLTINQTMDDEIAEMLVEAFELKAVVKKEESLEDQFVTTAIEQDDPPETLRPRPPVVTFLGHVDHGKTSLLDRILHLNVVSGEKGGITQHIRSYRITTPQGDVTFVDTPGHEAFTEMRARGANCTDIAVLVVAADDGVMPQTEEAISHAKAAGVPIVVALNKMDLPGVNRDRVVQELAANDLMPSEWGGDVEIVETSAVTGKGIDELMETLLMVAELNELKARPDRKATGVAIESSLQPGQGVLCSLLVQNGTLRTGDTVLCGNAYGKIRAMFDTLDSSKEIEEAGPSTPVSVLGFDVAPGAGSTFVVLEDISVARQIAEERTQILHQRELNGGESHVTLENLKARLDSKTQQTLNVIIRTDVRGSIEAIRKELSKLDHPEVKIKILQASVGGITEADVLLADASDAIIVGFNVVPDELARTVAEKKKVQIRRYDIIYKLSEDIKAALEGMLKPVEQVKELGRVIVKQIFVISRVGTIAGCRVLSGTVERDCRVRLIRDSRIIGEYVIETLKREKDDAKEVREGYECGIKLKGFNDIKEGDYFEAYKIEEIARTL